MLPSSYRRTDPRIKAAFDREELRAVCALPEREFGQTYGLTKTTVRQQRAPDNYYFYKDNGSNVLAVAHLDTVAWEDERRARFVKTEAGLVVFSRALDDRLGAYVILDLLPKLGLKYDILLTVGEEMGRSTAAYFTPAKQYDWMIEFDRGGTDVVMYQYDDEEVRGLVRGAGARPADGIFSDISYLEHLGIKGFNWGVGYRDYHTERSHAFLDDTFEMVDKYLTFHEQNVGTYMPHYPLADLTDKEERRLWAEWEADSKPLVLDDDDDDDDDDDNQDWTGPHWRKVV